MRQSVTLEFGSFGHEALRRSAQHRHVPPEVLVRHAVRYYLSQRDDERASVHVPRFVRDERKPVGNHNGDVVVTLDFEDAEWAGLAEAAEAEQVTLERLLKHAVLLFVADLDQGRATAWTLDAD